VHRENGFLLAFMLYRIYRVIAGQDLFPDPHIASGQGVDRIGDVFLNQMPHLLDLASKLFQIFVESLHDMMWHDDHPRVDGATAVRRCRRNFKFSTQQDNYSMT
jgi:hypothetical protein